MLRADQHRIELKRKDLWLKVLRITPAYVEGEFASFMQQSKLDLSKAVEETITVDIERSFCKMEGISGQNLKNILNTYAIVNSDLDYC